MSKLLVFILLLGFAVSAAAESPCKLVKQRSLGFIKCHYIIEHDEWKLKYSTFAYKATHASGRHPDLIDHLCAAGGLGVQEDMGQLTVYTPCRRN